MKSMTSATQTGWGESNSRMKYWGFLVAKLAIVALLMKGLWFVLQALLAPPKTFMYMRVSRFGQDLPWTLAILLFSLLGVGLVYLVILDQQYRCRTCLRRLRMPMETGSWNHMLLFGPPRTEYICLYGHGTLKVPEVQISGTEPVDWQPHEDMWKELESFEETRK